MRSGEKFNSITHLVGAVLALVGLVPLVLVPLQRGESWQVLSFLVYGITLLLLYVMSTLYHSLAGRRKALFRRFDHMAIYLLIAGTYTPFTVVVLGGALGWSLFAVVWSLALVGIVHCALKADGGGTGVQVVISLIMGWTCLFGMEALMTSLPGGGFAWLLAGGLFYTAGVFFFVFDEKIPHGHGIWHLFVRAGSASHYISIVGFAGA